MDKPKTKLAEQYIKLVGSERKVKHVDSLYSDKFLSEYFD
jgi:hypothetical protein